jgi:hypothetical protein
MRPRSCSRGAFDVPIEEFALFGGDFVKEFISVSTAAVQLSHVRFRAPHPVSADTMQVSKYVTGFGHRPARGARHTRQGRWGPSR